MIYIVLQSYGQRISVFMVLGVRVHFCDLEEVLEDFWISTETGNVNRGIASFKLQLGFALLMKVLKDVFVAIPHSEKHGSPSDWRFRL